MKDFEPLAVDAKINKSLAKGFMKVTKSNFHLSPIKDYAYYCKNLNLTTSSVSRLYIYLLLNEFTRNMYLGTTVNIRNRLRDHAKAEVLGPNEQVALNALFIVELEEYLSDEGFHSPISQIVSIEHQLTKYMRKIGYDVRCQYNEMGDEVDNGLITENIDKRFVQKKVREELCIIDGLLDDFERMLRHGEYEHPYTWRIQKFTPDELESIETDIQILELLSSKRKSEYDTADWLFIRQCLHHIGLRISLYEQGINHIDDMIVLKRHLKK